jgi:hypothetical protein
MSSPGVPGGCILNVHVTLSSSAAAAAAAAAAVAASAAATASAAAAAAAAASAAAAAVYGNLSSASTTAADGATCTASVPGAQATADACCASVSATCHLNPTGGFADVDSTESCTTAHQGATKVENPGPFSPSHQVFRTLRTLQSPDTSEVYVVSLRETVGFEPCSTTYNLNPHVRSQNESFYVWDSMDASYI